MKNPVYILLARYVPKKISGIIPILIFLFLGLACEMLKPWPLKILIDDVIHSKPLPHWLTALSPETFRGNYKERLALLTVLFMIFLFLVSWVLNLFSKIFQIRFCQKINHQLAADLFSHVQRLSLRFHTRRKTGDVIRRLTTDSTCLGSLVRDAGFPAIVSIATLVSMLWIMWSLSPQLTLVSVVIVPFILFVFGAFAKKLEKRAEERQQSESVIYNIVEQSFNAVPVIQVFQREKLVDAQFHAATSQVLDSAQSEIKVQMVFKCLVEFCTVLGTAGVLWFGANLVLSGAITIGDILIFISYLASFYSPVNTLVYLSDSIQTGFASAKRVHELLETRKEVENKPSAKPIEKVMGSIELNQVVFGYEPGRPILQNINLKIQPGEVIAVVGPTGAGKTSMLGLIPRFYDPWEGRISIDGLDIRDIELQSLRRQISVVLQESFLFPISIKENISYGNPTASFSEIEEAARAANADAFIDNLPQGYDTKVGERGVTLSGGQRQRISIARAFLRKSPILLLDEPTSALDTDSEKSLVESIERLKKGRTCLIIAHRLSTIRGADRIVVLRSGQIEECGSHEELIKKGGLYSHLYRVQFG